jgi:glycosyltransferase involved in cell wall biosynthesis
VADTIQSTAPEGDNKVADRRDIRQVTTSVIIPAYNEVENIGPLADEILNVINTADMEEYLPADIVIIDDGSSDGTREKIQELADEIDCVTAVLLSRNFGQSSALSAGINIATGTYIITMDADRQNDPHDIPRLLDHLTDGYDCVSGWRKDRKDPATKRIPSAIQTYLARLTGPDIHDFGCTLTAYRAEAIDDINLYGEGHRYIPAKLHKKGYQISELPVNHRPRGAGETKYGGKRLIKGFVDLLFHIFWNRFSTRPLHFLGGAGFILLSVGIAIGSHAVVIKYAFGVELLPRTPRLILTVAFVLFGLQLLMFGFLSEMMIKIYYKDRAEYRVKQIYTGPNK